MVIIPVIVMAAKTAQGSDGSNSAQIRQILFAGRILHSLVKDAPSVVLVNGDQAHANLSLQLLSHQGDILLGHRGLGHFRGNNIIQSRRVGDLLRNIIGITRIQIIT